MLNLYLCSNKDGLHFLITSSTYKSVNNDIVYDLFDFIYFFTSHQQSFSYVGTGLPGLNQY